jgi:hypothetical protein
MSKNNIVSGAIMLGDKNESEFKNNKDIQEDYQFKFFKNNKFEKGKQK